ncbi:unnamed protein product [Ambrosiozyma monospora]|uniref:Unnamed protein product n=1 Tax=Ambrosiozyma monospora TaxID=43982 RepID=A0ACB5T9T6_AMBMO|nr:unnamed protein product [Ambrosiozyma monospora]
MGKDGRGNGTGTAGFVGSVGLADGDVGLYVDSRDCVCRYAVFYLHGSNGKVVVPSTSSSLCSSSSSSPDVKATTTTTNAANNVSSGTNHVAKPTNNTDQSATPTATAHKDQTRKYSQFSTSTSTDLMSLDSGYTSNLKILSLEQGIQKNYTYSHLDTGIYLNFDEDDMNGSAGTGNEISTGAGGDEFIRISLVLGKL